LIFSELAINVLLEKKNSELAINVSLEKNFFINNLLMKNIFSNKKQFMEDYDNYTVITIISIPSNVNKLYKLLDFCV